jgi:hypothetical protein
MYVQRRLAERRGMRFMQRAAGVAWEKTDP